MSTDRVEEIKKGRMRTVTVANRRVNVIDIFPNAVRKESRKKVETGLA
jgi:hypothetical protein